MRSFIQSIEAKSNFHKSYDSQGSKFIASTIHMDHKPLVITSA